MLELFKKFSLLSLTCLAVSCGTPENYYSISDSNVLGEGQGDLGYPEGPFVWGDTVSVYVHAAVSSSVEEGVLKAIDSWNTAAGDQLLLYMGRTEVERGESLYSSLDDNMTVVYEEALWAATTGKPLTTLGTTVWEVDPEDGAHISKGDIILNTENYTFQDSQNFSPSVKSSREIVDSETVILHEMGHLLGLGHTDQETDPTSIMLPFTKIGSGEYSRELSGGDISNIHDLYGDPNESF